MDQVWWNNILHFSYWNTVSLAVLIVFWIVFILCIGALATVSGLYLRKFSNKRAYKRSVSGLLLLLLGVSFVIALLFSVMQGDFNSGVFYQTKEDNNVWIKEGAFWYCVQGKEKDQRVDGNHWDAVERVTINDIENYYNS